MQIHLFLFGCVIVSLVTVASFQPKYAGRSISSSYRHTDESLRALISRSASNQFAISEPPSKKGTTKVKFIGEKCVSSLPVAVKTDDVALVNNNFFAKSEHRNLLVSKDNNVQIIEAPSKEIIEIWSVESKSLGGYEIRADTNVADDKTCEVIQITTDMQFPGLKVITKSTIGSKLLLSPDENNSSPFPEYQFTLIDTELLPEGPGPIVWLFNKLTGAGKSAAGGARKERPSSSLTRVNMTSFDKNRADSNAVFTTDAYLETTISIPSVMMRLLPVSLEKFEEQGSMSMQKALEKDMEPALKRFRAAYMNWTG